MKLCELIAAAINENGLAPGRLHIEITEAAAMQYLDQVRSLILKLNAIGCRVVLDDFGRGPACQFLQQLPVDMVKIDGDLIRGLSAQGSTRALIEDIIAAAHAQGIEVTAKCVEDAGLLEILREVGVDYAQGFAIGMPVEAIEQLQALVADAG